MLVDSHCHLDFKDFADELDSVVERAETAGVGLMVTICTRLSEFDRVLAIADRYENVYCSVGVHPHDAALEGPGEADALVELAAHPKVVGVGETGLDYYYERSPREAQKRSFRTHIDAARRTGLPLIVHNRDADDDTRAILVEEAEKGPFTGVLHCFASGRALAESALDLGFYVSFSGILTFKNAEALRAIARDIPSDRLLVETDAPYLAPVPMRGRRNEPAYVSYTAAGLAEIKACTPDALARTTTDNFFRLFAKADRGQARLSA
ncbi:MAG: TatD family hydrolase [Alphaproteobacteria bacterium]